MKKLLNEGMKGDGASSFLRFMRWARFFLSPVEKRVKAQSLCCLEAHGYNSSWAQKTCAS